jgi:hypothetical protein
MPPNAPAKFGSAGGVIQDDTRCLLKMLGVKKWDGIVGNDWATQLDDKPIVDASGKPVGNDSAAPIVDADGTISLTGYHGGYERTIGGKTYSLDLEKGVSDYTITVAEPSAALLAICGWATLVWIVSFVADTPWRVRATFAAFGTMIRKAKQT